MDPTPAPARVAELAASLAAVRERIAAAAHAAGREPGEVTLVAVTKTFPASDVAALRSLGVVDVGENKDQEARGKLAELAADPLAAGLRWHLVGQLQSNKARSVASYAAAVHSVDRAKIVTALDRAAQDRCDVSLDVFVQVSLDGAAGRGGAPVGEVPALADAVAAAAGLRLRGVMAVAPAGWEPARAFAALAGVAAGVRVDHPAAGAISAGMSGDLEAAIAHGATHVRVGSALLGGRPPVLG